MAHYTTAESAALILKNQSLWLGSASMMNDFSEIAHGGFCLSQSRQAGLGCRLETALDAVHPGLWRAVAEWIKGLGAHTRDHTYLISLSAPNPDNVLGKLSMGRAYGGPTSGVAIILNNEPFWHDSDQLGAYPSPVLYGGVEEFSRELCRRAIENIEINQELLKVVPFGSAKSIIFNSLQYSILSTKHPAFEEEREWRVIHSPQMICEIPLRDQPGLNMPWLNILSNPPALPG